MNSTPRPKIKAMGEFKVPKTAVNMRADVFLAKKYPDFTRSSLERLFDEHSVKIGSLPIKPSHKLKQAEKIKVDETVLKQAPAEISLSIIYQDDDVVVINKPEGILSHSKGVMNDEATVASFIAPKLSRELTGNRAGIVHRLDRPTSGVILTVKNRDAQNKIQKQFSQRKVKKTYIAIVEGVPELQEAVIEAPIERNPKRPQTFRANADGKPATTQYKTVESFSKSGKGYSLLELKPLTGRTHQLRVHLSYIGHPIVGDHLYGRSGEHLYLHAISLELTLPTAGRRVFRVDLPSYFNDFMRKSK